MNPSVCSSLYLPVRVKVLQSVCHIVTLKASNNRDVIGQWPLLEYLTTPKHACWMKWHDFTSLQFSLMAAANEIRHLNRGEVILGSSGEATLMILSWLLFHRGLRETFDWHLGWALGPCSILGCHKKLEMNAWIKLTLWSLWISVGLMYAFTVTPSKVD